VVVSRLDHDANVRPWVIAAERAGATVRWLEFDVDTTEPDDVGPLLSDRTRVVAVTGASNLVGTRPDVAGIAAQAHAAGALVVVDAVHLAAHAPVDRAALGADVVLCSPYKFCGPHLGVLAADPALLESLEPDKLLPAPAAAPDKFEVGTLSWELLAGATAAVGFLEGLGGTAAVDEHEQELFAHLLEGLAATEGVTTYGRARHRTPTVLLRKDGEAPAATSARLAEADVVAPASTFYAVEPAGRLGLAPEGGVRVGLAPYTNADDVDRLLAALR
jgi:cysteine desulfurase family protein (TIGR01976 family)